jgi:hypothetical protein
MLLGMPMSLPTGRVVVGVNGSPSSLAALRHAAAHAQRHAAELEVVRVIPALAGAGADPEARALLGQIIREELPTVLSAAVRRRTALATSPR